MVKLFVALVEPATIAPALGVKIAVSCAVDAANDVWHATVTLCPLGVTGMPAQPLIGVPSSSKDNVPDGAAPVTVDVTDEINVTFSLVTAVLGDVRSTVVLAADVGSVPRATTTAV